MNYLFTTVLNIIVINVIKNFHIEDPFLITREKLMKVKSFRVNDKFEYLSLEIMKILSNVKVKS